MADLPHTQSSSSAPDPVNSSVESTVPPVTLPSSATASETSGSASLGVFTTASEANDESIDINPTGESTPGDETEREHWKTVNELAADITSAAESILSNRKKSFSKVVAVIAYWQNASGLAHLRKEADKLHEVFARLNFEVYLYKIPDSEPDWNFVSTIGGQLTKVSKDRDSLFILYYGGHATMEEWTNKLFWKKENQKMSPEVEWSSAIRTLFRTGAICSKLFIFDCCHAGGMIDSTLNWETSCELLGACAADVQASALRVSSFTRALREEVSKHTYDIWELHSALCDPDNRAHYNLSKFPYYRDFMGKLAQATSALLKKVGSPVESAGRALKAAETLRRLTTMAREAVFCVAVTFQCDAQTLVQQVDEIKKNWRRWFRFAPTEFNGMIVKACRAVDLVAAFNANSCVTIWTFPVWLWDAMAPRSGYQCIGIIHPQNLALPVSGTKTALAMPVSSSKEIMNPASPSRRLSKRDTPVPLQETIVEDVAGEEDSQLEPVTARPYEPANPAPEVKLLTGNRPQQPAPKRDPQREDLWDFPPSSYQNLQEPRNHGVLASPSRPIADHSRIPVASQPDPLPRLVDIVSNPAEKRKASKIEQARTSRRAATYLSGLFEPQHDVRFPEYKRQNPVSVH
jgi:hypothetical protein